MPYNTRLQTKKSGSQITHSVSPPTPSVPGNLNRASTTADMAENVDTPAAQLEIQLDGLSNENKALALVIIQAVTNIMEKKLDDERRESRNIIENLERKLIAYQEKIDDLESYGRRNTMVISGPSMPTAVTDEDSIAVAVQLIQAKLDVPIVPEDICVAHRLGARKSNEPDKRNIIVKFVRRTKKHEIYKACAVKKPRDLFFSDSLTRIRHTICFSLRQAKKRDPTKFGKIRTRDGNIRLELPNLDNPRTSTTVVVNTRAKLEDLLLTRLGIDSSAFDCRW